MSVARTLGVLNLYDVLTDLIPGTIVVGCSLILFHPLLPSLSGTVLVTGVIVSGYVFGHVIRQLRGIRYRPTDFQDRLHDAKSHLDKEIVSQLQDRYDLPDLHESEEDTSGPDGSGEAKPQNLFKGVPDSDLMPLVLSYLEVSPAVRALRMQAMFSFYRSMFVASLTVIGLSLVAAGLYVFSELSTNQFIISGVTILGGLLSVTFYFRRERYKKMFVKYTIRDFYVDSVMDVEPED